MIIKYNKWGLFFALFPFYFLLFSNSVVAAQFSDPDVKWFSKESDHFIVHYSEGISPIADTAIAVAETAYQKLGDFFDWRPRHKTHMILTDRVDYSNGAATPWLRNTMIIHVSPPDDLDALADHGNWLELVIFHEYTHVLHLDMATGFPGFLRRIFGRMPNVFLFPNMAEPHWMKEGLATWIETDKQRGIGRGQSSYFEMMMRTEVMSGIQPVRQVNQIHGSWPAGNTAYLYGVYFYQFVAQTYGVEKLKELIREYSDNFFPYFINHNSKQVLHSNYLGLWQEFDLWLRKKFKPQIDQLKNSQLIEGRRLTHYGYFTAYPKLHGGDIYFIKSDGQSRPVMMKRTANGETTKLFDLNGEARFDINRQGDIVLAMPEVYSNAEVYYDLFLYNAKNRKLKKISSEGRYRFVCWRPDGEQLIAVHYEAGQYTLKLLDRSAHEQAVLWQAPKDVVISNPVLSPDGKTLVAALWQPEDGWNLHRFDLQTRQWQALTFGKEIENHPSFSEDGKSLYYSADNNGVYNIHVMNLESGEIQRLTNVMTGAFNPQVGDGKLAYIGYHIDGYDLYQMDLSQTDKLSESPVEPASSGQYVAYDLKTAIPQTQPYAGLRYLVPTWWGVALTTTTEGDLNLGLSTSGSDPLSQHYYDATLFYNQPYNNVEGRFNYLNYQTISLINLALGREIVRQYKTPEKDSPYVDTEQSFVGASVSVPFIKTNRQFTANFSGELDSGAIIGGNAEPTRQLPNLFVAAAGLMYNSTFSGPLSTHPVDGQIYQFFIERHEYSDGDSGSAARLDLREYIDLGNQYSFALRMMAVSAFEGAAESSLGGSLNFEDTSSWGANSYNLRGYPMGFITGKQLGLFSAEWRFPLTLVERGWMAPPMAIDRFAGKLFFDAGADLDGIDKERGYTNVYDRFYKSVGAEFIMDTLLFYGFPLRFRYGFVKPLDVVKSPFAYLTISQSF